MENSELTEYVNRILSEREELDTDADRELLLEAADVLRWREAHGIACSVDDALKEAEEVLSNGSGERWDECEKEFREEGEYCGIRPLTLDELLRRLEEEMKVEPGESRKHDPLHAKIARKILEHQAKSLMGEPCVESMRFFGGEGLWRAAIRFRDGQLSHEAQVTLAKMKFNAHRTIMTKKDDLTVIRFIVSG